MNNTVNKALMFVVISTLLFYSCCKSKSKVQFDQGSSTVFIDGLPWDTQTQHAIIDNKIVYIIWHDISGSHNGSICTDFLTLQVSSCEGNSESDDGRKLSWECIRSDSDNWILKLNGIDYDLSKGFIILVNTKSPNIKVKQLKYDLDPTENKSTLLNRLKTNDEIKSFFITL